MPENPIDPNTQHLNNIAQTNDHALVQGADHMQATKDLLHPMEGILVKTDEIAQNTKPKDVQKVQVDSFSGPTVDDFQKTFWNMIRGPIGATGEQGDTPEKGKDYFTPDEISSFKSDVTPVKGLDYHDGEAGRNPMHVGHIAPTDPQKGDLWYQG